MIRKHSASDLVESVAFDAPTQQPDGSGGTDAGWALDVHSCRAGLTFLRGGETVLAARLTGTAIVVAVIRANPAAAFVTPDWRMRHLHADGGETIYNVRSVLPTKDRAWLEITCESGVAV